MLVYPLGVVISPSSSGWHSIVTKDVHCAGCPRPRLMVLCCWNLHLDIDSCQSLPGLLSSAVALVGWPTICLCVRSGSYIDKGSVLACHWVTLDKWLHLPKSQLLHLESITTALQVVVWVNLRCLPSSWGSIMLRVFPSGAIRCAFLLNKILLLELKWCHISSVGLFVCLWLWIFL